jgi:arylsulfatase A-like enzyme
MYGDWEPYAQARQAMEFIDRHADKPFALFVSWHAPHNWGGKAHEGYDAPGDLLALYDPARLTLRPTVKDTSQVRTMYQGHLAMITSLDRAFGWLLDKLKERGVADNTIVVFTADHGDMLMSYDWPNNKGRAEHGSSRVPLLIRWPAQLKPGVSDLLVGSMDLMPTLLGMMDLPVPTSCQGRNAAAAVLAGRDDGVDALPLLYLPANWRGVYTHRYTYSESVHNPSDDLKPDAGAVYNVLYDRQADPWETRNLFHLPEYASLRKELHTRTFELMRRFDDAGLPYHEIQKQVLLEADVENVMTHPQKRPRGWEGRLKGRPVDILKHK